MKLVNQAGNSTNRNSEDRVEDSEKLKQFQAMVEVSRKWVTVMDAKAAFV